jgi:NADH:ubiquinone oxidoreductase subunit 6 (subunit J)
MMNFFGNGQSLGIGSGMMIGLGALAVIIAIIVVALKGYALWNAAKRDEKWWFIILLIINTLGILELIYLYFVVGKWHSKSSPAQGTNNFDSTNSGSNTPASPTPAV